MKKMNISIPREYEKNGEKKTQWIQAGVLITTDEGKQFGIINQIPPNWDGKFNVFEPKEENTDPF